MEKLNQEFVNLPPSSAPANMAVLASIGPITPDSKRESGEFLFDFAPSSPLSFISSSSPPKDIVEYNSSISTPKEEGVSFDPFATTNSNDPPPPHKLLWLALEHLKCHRPSVGRRQLTFESPVNSSSHGSYAKSIPEEEEEEDMLLETVVYETLLEVIISEQTDESSSQVLDEILVPPSPHQTSPPKTPPTCAPHLDGVAETCPAAPIKKCTSKSRNIDRALCRKLEF